MNPQTQKPDLQVFFDGSCPLCDREIAYYARLDRTNHMEWIDISCTEENRLPSQVTQSQAMARFHVCDDQGRVFSGARAFAELWARLPAFRWLGHIAKMRPVAWALERCYRFFLRFRPRLSQYLRNRQA